MHTLTGEGAAQPRSRPLVCLQKRASKGSSLGVSIKKRKGESEIRREVGGPRSVACDTQGEPRKLVDLDADD